MPVNKARTPVGKVEMLMANLQKYVLVNGGTAVGIDSNMRPIPRVLEVMGADVTGRYRLDKRPPGLSQIDSGIDSQLSERFHAQRVEQVGYEIFRNRLAAALIEGLYEKCVEHENFVDQLWLNAVSGDRHIHSILFTQG